MSFDSFESVTFVKGFFGFLMHNLPNLAILLSMVLIKKNKLKGYVQILISVILFFLYGVYRFTGDQWAIYIILFTLVVSGLLHVIEEKNL
jgi:uncharacterized membrane protein